MIKAEFHSKIFWYISNFDSSVGQYWFQYDTFFNIRCLKTNLNKLVLKQLICWLLTPNIVDLDKRYAKWLLTRTYTNFAFLVIRIWHRKVIYSSILYSIGAFWSCIEVWLPDLWCKRTTRWQMAEPRRLQSWNLISASVPIFSFPPHWKNNTAQTAVVARLKVSQVSHQVM